MNKKIIIALVVIGLMFVVSGCGKDLAGQAYVATLDNTSQNNLFVSKDGYVGIGTTNPGVALHVKGNQLYVEGTTGAPGIHVRNSAGGAAAVFGDTGGNVGIGTSTPSMKLDVFGSYGLTGREIIRDSSNILIGDVNAAGGAKGVTIRTGGGDKVTIGTNGNVGIGTSTPSSKLEVKGDLKLSNPGGPSLVLDRNGQQTSIIWDGSRIGIAAAGGRVGIGTNDPSSKLEVKGDIKAEKLCLNGKCISSWDELTTSAPTPSGNSTG
jgi:hypothetical protein